MSEVIHVSDDTFEQEVLKSDKPVLLDYWAEWCQPCKQLAPLLDDCAKEYTDTLKIAKLNIDSSPKSAQKYGVRGIPTLMLFINGEIEATKIGALSKSQLIAFIDSTL